MSKTWFITGASRGLGVEIARAALKSGDRVVATGRRREAVLEQLGPETDRLLAIELDVTDADGVRAAVKTALSAFGGIDILVNNAGYGHLGFFEENSIGKVREQFETNLFGVFNVTWAVLPSMRAAKEGRIFNLSSLAGIRGAEFGSLYSASKFALEGYSESLAAEVAPFGISVTIVEPGPFRTEFLTPESLRIGDRMIADYDERRATLQSSFEDRNGQQPGDPVKLSEAIVRLSRQEHPPMRLTAGAVAFSGVDAKLAAMKEELDTWRDLSLNTDFAPIQLSPQPK